MAKYDRRKKRDAAVLELNALAEILGRLRRKFRQVLGQVLAQDGAGCIPSHGVGLRAMEQFAPQGPSMGSDSERPPYNTKLTPRYHLTPVLI